MQALIDLLEIMNMQEISTAVKKNQMLEMGGSEIKVISNRIP